MNWPKISVITPSYNQGDFIEETILSVLDQNYPNLEYIVMDGGSTDQTVRILKKYQKHLTWFSEPDHGQADAINKGLRMSTGSILAYLNSDDTYEPKTLHTIAQYFMQHKKAQFVYGVGKLINVKGNDIGMYNNLPMNHETLFVQCGISQPTVFWTKKVYQTIGEFDTSYHYTMDYDYWIRASEKFQLHFLKDTILANTRIHKDAKTSKATHKLHLDAVRTTYAHYGKVHCDWINTLADGVVHNRKTGNTLDRCLYWIYMISATSYLHIKYNHELPPKIQQNYYVQWLREAIGK